MKIYLAKQGDTLESVAQTQNLNVDKLKEMNPNLTQSEPLATGTKIVLSKSANGELVHAQESCQVYTVKQGDTLWKLSKKWGIELQSLVQLNPQLKNPNVLMTNESIHLPQSVILQDDPLPATEHCPLPESTVSPHGSGIKYDHMELFNPFSSLNENVMVPQNPPYANWTMQQQIACPNYAHVYTDQPLYPGATNIPNHAIGSPPPNDYDTTMLTSPSYANYPMTGLGCAYPISYSNGYSACNHALPPMHTNHLTPTYTQNQVLTENPPHIHLHEKYNPYPYALHTPYPDFGDTQTMTSLHGDTHGNAQYSWHGQSEHISEKADNHPSIHYPETYVAPALPQAPLNTQPADENLIPCKEEPVSEQLDTSKEKPDIKLRNRTQKAKSTRKQSCSSQSRAPMHLTSHTRTR